MKNKSIFRRIRKTAVALSLALVTFMSTSMSTFATVDFSGTSSGSGSSGSMSGSYIAYYDSGSISYAVGYRFAIIDNRGMVDKSYVIDVYNSRHDTSKKVVKIGGRRKAKQEIIATGSYANQKVSFGNWNGSDIEWATCSGLGINKQLPANPAEIDAWVTENNNARLNKILQVVGSSCSSIMSDTAMVSVEPIFEIRASGVEVSGTVTDLAVLLGQLYGNMNAAPSPSNTPGSPASISKATNRILPDLLFMTYDDKKATVNPSALEWAAATKIGSRDVRSYSNLISQGYGVGICYGKKVTESEKITVKYYNKISSDSTSEVIKTTTITRGSKFNLAYASTFSSLQLGGYEFVGWNLYDRACSSSTYYYWGYKTDSTGLYVDGWYKKGSGAEISDLPDHTQLNATQTDPNYSKELHLYPVRSSQQFVHIGYYVDYDAYQAGTDIGNSIYYYGDASNISYTKLYKTQQAGNTAPLFWPGGKISGMNGNYDVLPAVNTEENTSNKYRSFTGWVIYNDAKKKWCGYNEAADSFAWYDSYEKAAANQIATTYMLNSTKYKGSYSNYNGVEKLNDFFGKYCYNTTGNIGNYYVVGVYKGELCNLRYKTAMTDSATVSGYLNSVGSGISDTTAWNNYFSTCLNPLDQKNDTNRKDVAWVVYWTDENKENTSWWESPGYPWDTNDVTVYIQNEQPVDYNKLKIEKAEYSVCPLTDCYTSEQLNNFVNLGSTKRLPKEHFEGFEFGGWTFICKYSTAGTLYYGYNNNNVLGWYTLDKINKNKTNSDTSYYGFYIMQPEEALKDNFFETGNRKSNINLFALWKELPTYTVNYYEDDNLLGSQNIPASDVIKAQTNGTSYQFYSRYNKKINTAPNSAYDYLGWSYDSSANATPNIGFEFTNGNDTQCYSGYEAYSSVVSASPTGFTWQADSNGNKYVNLYAVKNPKPYITVKYNPNGDMDYVANSGDGNGITGTMSDKAPVLSDTAIANGIPLDSCAYIKESYTFNKWAIYSSQMNGYYGKRAGVTSYEWITDVNEIVTFATIRSTDTLFTSENTKFLKDTGVTSGEIILYATWGAKYDVYYTTQHPAGSNIVSNYDSSLAGDGYPVHKEYPLTSFVFLGNKFEDKSGNYEDKGWSVYITDGSGNKTYYCDNLNNVKIYQRGSSFALTNLVSLLGGAMNIPGAKVYVEAQWKPVEQPNSIVVKYNPNSDMNYTVDGGDNSGITGVMSDKVYTVGTDISIADNLYKKNGNSHNGWVLYSTQKAAYYSTSGGWTTSSDSSAYYVLPKSNGKLTFSGILNGITDGELILFAVWKADACSIQFMRNTRCGLDDYVTNVPNSVQAEKGSEFTIPSGNENTPKLSDGSNELEFIGWNTEPKGTGTSYSPGSNITLSQSVLNENDTLVLYAQWKINLDISLDDVYYTLDGNGSSRVEDHIKLKENSSYFTFLEIHNNSIHFDVSFGFTSNVTIANKSLNNGGVTASGPTVSKGSIYTLNVGRVTVTPPSDNSLTGTFFTADSAIVKLTGQVWIVSVINPINGGKVDWTYHETNNDNDSKKLEKNFVINAPKTSSLHQGSSDVYSGQLIKGTHSYSNMSLFDAIFSFFAERYNYSNLQVSRYDEDFTSYNDGGLLISNSGPFSASGYNVFTESKSYRYRNVGTYPISFADSRSKMSWLNSNPEIFGESRSTLTVYPIDLIADNINVCKEGSSVVYNKGVHPEETYSVEATYLLKTMLGSVGDLHTNIQVTVFGITEDGDREYICQSTSSGVTFPEHTTTDNGYVYQLKLKTDSFTVAKKYTGIYINGYIYDSDLMHTAYSTFFEQNGTNNTFEMDIPVLSPFNVEFIKPNAWYTRGKEVVSGFRVTNNSPYNLKNDIGYTISVYDVKKITKDTIPVERKSGFLGVPSANTTMVWIKWTVPDDMPDEAYIKIVVDTGAVYNTKTITASWGVKDNLVFNTPDTAYSDSAPYWYSDAIGTENAIDMSSYNLDYNNKGNDVDSFSWNYFVYDNATDGYLYVTNEVSANGTAVISKKGCPDTDDGSIKSGYGYGLNLSTSITSTAPEDAVTGCQNAYVAFPEFNNAVTGKADDYYQFSLDTAASYLINPAGVRSGFKNIGSSMANISTDKHNGGSYGTFATLKKSGDNFEMPINSSTGDATHFIPIWMPDGDYEVTGIIDEIWTPMGMISKKIVSNTLQIRGNMYDDFKVSHYTIKQEE